MNQVAIELYVFNKSEGIMEEKDDTTCSGMLLTTTTKWVKNHSVLKCRSPQIDLFSL